MTKDQCSEYRSGRIHIFFLDPELFVPDPAKKSRLIQILFSILACSGRKISETLAFTVHCTVK